MAIKYDPPASPEPPSSSITVYDIANDARRIERNTFSHGFSRRKELAFSTSEPLARLAGMFETKSAASFERIPVASFMTDPESSIAVGRRQLKDTFIAVTGSFRESMVMSRNTTVVNAKQLIGALGEKTELEYAQLPGVIYDRLGGEIGLGDTLLDDSDGVIQLSRQHRVSGVEMSSQIVGINLWREGESTDLLGEEEVMDFLKTKGKKVKNSEALGPKLSKEAMAGELFELPGYEISPIIKVSAKAGGEPFDVIYNTGELRRQASDNIKLAFEFRDKIDFKEGRTSHSRLQPQVYRMIDAIAGRRLGEETRTLYGDTNFPSLELKKPGRIFFDIETSSNRYLPENKRTITQFAFKDDSTKSSLSFFNLSEIVRKEDDGYRINYDVLESLPSSTARFREQKALIETLAEAVTKGDFVENDEGLFETVIGSERHAFSLTREQAFGRISRFLQESDAKEMAGYNIKEFDIPFLERYFGGDIFQKAVGDHTVYDVYEDVLKNKGFAEGFYGVDLGKTATLSSIYRSFTGRAVSGAHEAGFDVEMTIDIADRLAAMKNTTEKVRASGGESYNQLYDNFSRLLEAGGRALGAEPTEYYYDYDQFGDLVKYASNMPYLPISLKGKEHKGIYGALQESYEGSLEKLVSSFLKGRVISYGGVDFTISDAKPAESDLSSRVFAKPLNSIHMKDLNAVKDVSVSGRSLKSEIKSYAKNFIKFMRDVEYETKADEYKSLRLYSQKEIDRKSKSVFDAMIDSDAKLKDDVRKILTDRTSKPEDRAKAIKELAKTISLEGTFDKKGEDRIETGLKKASAYLKRMETLEKGKGIVPDAKRQAAKAYNVFNMVFGTALSVKTDAKREFLKAATPEERMKVISKSFGETSTKLYAKAAKEYTGRVSVVMERIAQSGGHLVDGKGLGTTEIAQGVIDVLTRRALGNFNPVRERKAGQSYDPVVENAHALLNKYAKELNVEKLYTQTLIEAYGKKAEGKAQMSEAQIREAATKELKSSIEEVDSTAKASDLLKFWFSMAKAEDVDPSASHLTRRLLGTAQSENEDVVSEFDSLIDGVVLREMASAAKKQMENVSSLSLIDMSGRNMFDIVLSASERSDDVGNAYEEMPGPVLEYARQWRSIQMSLGEFSNKELEEDKKFLGYISDKYGKSMIDAIAGKTDDEETFVKTFLEELQGSKEFAGLYRAFSSKEFNEEGIGAVSDFLLRHSDSIDEIGSVVASDIREGLSNSFLDPEILKSAETREKLVGAVSQVIRDRYSQAYVDMGRSSIEWTSITPVEISEVAKTKDFLVEDSVLDSVLGALTDRSNREFIDSSSTKFTTGTDIEKLARVFAGFSGEYSDAMGIEHDAERSAEYIAERITNISERHYDYGFETPEEFLAFMGGYGKYEEILDQGSDNFENYSAMPIFELAAGRNDDFKLSSTSMDLLQQKESDVVEYDRSTGYIPPKKPREYESPTRYLEVEPGMFEPYREYEALNDTVIENVKKRTAEELRRDSESVRLLERAGLDSKIVMDIGEARTIEPSSSVRSAMSSVPRDILNALKINFTEKRSSGTDAMGTSSEKYRKYMADALDAITYVFQGELGAEASDLEIARAISTKENYTESIVERIINTANMFFANTSDGSITNAEIASGKEARSVIASLDSTRVSAEFLPDVEEAATTGEVQVKIFRGENIESIISIRSNAEMSRAIIDRMSELNEKFNDLDYNAAIAKIELLQQAGILKESPIASGSAMDIFDKMYRLRNVMFSDEDIKDDLLLLDSLAEEYEKEDFLDSETERLPDDEIEAQEYSRSEKYADDIDVHKEALAELEKSEIEEPDSTGMYSKEIGKIYGPEHTTFGQARPFQEYKRNIQLRSLYTPGANVIIAGEKGDEAYTVVEPVFGLPVLEDRTGQRYVAGIGENGVEALSLSMRTVLRQLLPNSGQYANETQSVPSKLIDAIHTATADYFDEYIQEQRRLGAREVVKMVVRSRPRTAEESTERLILEKTEQLAEMSSRINAIDLGGVDSGVNFIDVEGNMGKAQKSVLLEELSDSKGRFFDELNRLKSSRGTNELVEETAFEKTIEFPEAKRLPPERLLAAMDIISEAFERIEPSEIIEGRKGSQAIAEAIVDIHNTAQKFEAVSKEITEMVDLFDEKTVENLSEGARTLVQSMTQAAKRQTQAAQYISQGATDAAEILNSIGDNIREFFDDMKNGEYTEAAYVNFLKMLSDTYSVFYSSYGQTQDVRIGSAEHIERGLEGIKNTLSQFVRDGKVNVEAIENIQKIVDAVHKQADEAVGKQVEEKPVTNVIEDFKRIFKSEFLNSGEKKTLKTAGLIGGGILAAALTIGAISRANLNKERERAEMNAASQVMPANRINQFVPTSPDVSMYMNSNYGLDSSAIASVALSRTGQNSKVSIIGR